MQKYVPVVGVAGPHKHLSYRKVTTSNYLKLLKSTVLTSLILSSNKTNNDDVYMLAATLGPVVSKHSVYIFFLLFKKHSFLIGAASENPQ